jgi:hypothetical protein
MHLRLYLLVCLLAGFVSPAAAADYYVSAGGADTNAGTAPQVAWRTLARVNAVALQPGDRVWLRAGDTFVGGLALDSGDAGTASAPIAIASYGSGRAAIYAGAGTGIFVYNTSGVSIANLTISGAGQQSSGISFYTDLPGDVRLPFVRIDAVDVSGFGRDGIEIGAWNGRSGFADVRVTNSAVHHNGRNGLFTYARLPNAHRQVYVGHVRAYENPGTPGAASNTGSGIVLASVDGATIERSVAHDNGRLCDSSGGPVGIWTYDSTRVTIQHNESYRNRTAASWDGGGFDLDQNVSDSLVQYNYSHDNDGAGFLLAQSLANDAHARNIVRFNISQNDGRANSYGGIEVWGRVIAAEIYNNTVFMSGATTGSPRAVRVWNAGVTDRFTSGVHVRNNIFVTTGLPVIEASAAALAGAVDLRFEGNDYYSGGASPAILWGGTSFAGLAAWRATGQETMSGSPTGLSVDPQLMAAGAGPSFGDADQLASLDAYRVRATSPLADAGLDLRSLFGLSTGTSDFFGGQLGLGTGFAIGAHELPEMAAAGIDEIVLYATSARTIAGAWRRIADTTAAGGARLHHPNQNAAKLPGAFASPANYFDLTFEADAGKPYRLWIRSIAEGNTWNNESVFVQFSSTVDAAGAPTLRIGTTSSTTVNLEEDNNAGVLGWGWQDNGWGTGVMGTTITFATTGLHTIRVQTREDGVSIDQIVLSARKYLTAAPGPMKNDTTILHAGTTATPEPDPQPAPPPAPTPTPTPTPAGDIVIHAASVPSAALHGNWALAADTSAAGGVALLNANQGAAKATAAAATPASYVDVPFTAQAGVPYQIWIRMRAQGDGYANDSIYVQLSGAVDASGQAVARIGTAQGHAVVLQDYDQAAISGWGWNDNGWATIGTPYLFAQSGAQTLRIQQREDGIAIDQIVISPATYLSASPGAARNDATIIR